MATFTLENLREAADKKYAPTVIEAGDDSFTLQNLLRMEDSRRKRVSKLLEKADALSDEKETAKDFDATVKIFREIVVEAEANGRGKELVELVNDDAVLIDVVTAWLEASQAGEA